MAQATINLVANDLLPVLQVEYEGADVTGYEIFLNVEREDGSRFQRQATITNVGSPATGVPAQWEYEWEEGDLVAGTHKAEIELYDGIVGGPGVKNETFNGIRLVIDSELG